MTVSFALALSLIAFAALALAMHRHHQQVWGRDPSRKTRLLLRLVGTAALGSSLIACVAGSGWATGPVLWLGLLSVAGLTIALLLAYRPRIVAFAMPAVLLLAIAMSGSAFAGAGAGGGATSTSFRSSETETSFTMDRTGRVLGFRLERSSGFEALDKETLDLIQRSQPLPPPPPAVLGKTVELVVPVQFFLRR